MREPSPHSDAAFASHQPPTVACGWCGMPLALPRIVVSPTLMCPNCSREVALPGTQAVAAPNATTVTMPRQVKTFTDDPRTSDQWSASLSEYRLPDINSAKETVVMPRAMPPTYPVAAMAPEAPPAATAFAPRALPPVPIAAKGPETVEELLQGVQFTVIESDPIRPLILNVALFVIIAGLAAWYGPQIFKRYFIKPAENTAPVMVKSSPKAVAAPRNIPPSPAPAVVATVAPSSSGWKPFQGQPAATRSATGPNGHPINTPSNAGQPIQDLSARLWGGPARQDPRYVAFSTSNRQGFATPTAFAPQQSVNTPTVIVDDSVGRDSPLAVGEYRGKSPADALLSASLIQLPSPTSDTPEWMRLPTNQWPDLLLLNDASFRGHSGLDSTACFLAKGNSNNTWLITPDAVLSGEWGATPPFNPDDLRRKLVRWSGHSPENNDRLVEVKNTQDLVVVHRYSSILLKVPDTQVRLAARPLKLRTEATVEGETLFAAALPSSQGFSQVIVPTRVNAVIERRSMTMQAPGLTDTSELLGAVLLDIEGNVAGMITFCGTQNSMRATMSTALLDAMAAD